MEHLLRELLTGLLRKFWPHKPDPRWPIEEVLREKRRFMRLYHLQLLLFFVNWGLLTWLLGSLIRWLFFQTLRLPPDAVAWLLPDSWNFYAVAFVFGIALAGPLSNVWLRALTDQHGYEKFQQFVEWKNQLDNRAAIPLVALFFLAALVSLWFLVTPSFILTTQKVIVRDTWRPVLHERPLTDIHSIDHYTGFINRGGNLRNDEYYELVMADGKTHRFADSDGLTSEAEMASRIKVIAVLKELTGLEVREMGVATPFE